MVVCVGAKVAVGVGVGVNAGVAVAVAVDVAVGVGVKLGVGVRVGVGDGEGVGAQAGGIVTADASSFHSSRPCSISTASKNRVGPIAVNWVRPASALTPGPVPSRMSWIMNVPQSVALLVQSSNPCGPSVALKNSLPSRPNAATLSVGGKLEADGWMSFTITVPAGVPSLFQNRGPFAPSYSSC